MLRYSFLKTKNRIENCWVGNILLFILAKFESVKSEIPVHFIILKYALKIRKYAKYVKWNENTKNGKFVGIIRLTTPYDVSVQLIISHTGFLLSAPCYRYIVKHQCYQKLQYTNWFRTFYPYCVKHDLKFREG